MLIDWRHREMVAELDRDRRLYIDQARMNNPAAWSRLVSPFGHWHAENILVAMWRDQILSGKAQADLPEVGGFHHMLKSGNHKKNMAYIQGMKWTWLHSDYDFIIGDNPFCRCTCGGALNCPIAWPDLEVTFPLGRHLSLWMHRRSGVPEEIDIDQQRTVELNQRQIAVANSKAWRATEGALRPPPLQAEHIPVTIKIAG